MRNLLNWDPTAGTQDIFLHVIYCLSSSIQCTQSSYHMHTNHAYSNYKCIQIYLTGFTIIHPYRKKMRPSQLIVRSIYQYMYRSLGIKTKTGEGWGLSRQRTGVVGTCWRSSCIKFSQCNKLTLETNVNTRL